jgi:hypothetical protein
MQGERYAKLATSLLNNRLAAAQETGALLGKSFGNWISIESQFGNAVGTPHDQTHPVLTFVAAVVLRAQVSGIFYVTFAIQATDSVDVDTMSHSLVTNQSAGPGALTGGVAAGYSGANAIGASGMILNVDAAGGNGLLFDGNPQGLGAAHFIANQTTAAGVQTVCSWGNIVDATGSTSAVKTPFTIGDAVAFGVEVGTAGAATVHYTRLTLSAIELPFA